MGFSISKKKQINQQEKIDEEPMPDDISPSMVHLPSKEASERLTLGPLREADENSVPSLHTCSTYDEDDDSTLTEKSWITRFVEMVSTDLCTTR